MKGAQYTLYLFTIYSVIIAKNNGNSIVF